MNEPQPSPRPALPRATRLHRSLGSFGVLLLTLSCLSPVLSIYAIGPEVLLQAGTGAATAFLVGIGAAVVWAFVYAELASAYPYAGGDYVGVASILGPWAGFASLTIWAVAAGPHLALTAKTIAIYANDLAPAAAPGVVTLAALAAALAVALLAIRASAWVTGLFLGIELLAVFALAGAGLWHPARSLPEAVLHPVALSTAGVLAPVGFGAMALAAVIAANATMGGNQAIAFGEELREPHRRMGNVIVYAALIGALATAIPVIAVVVGAADLASILGSPAPFTAFFAAVAGTTAGHALTLGVIIAVFNALIVCIMFYARLFFSMGRDGIFNSATNAFLRKVHPASGVPRAATVAVTVLAAVWAPVEIHTLVVVFSGLGVYIIGLVSVTVLVGRRRLLTGTAGYWRSPLYPLVPVLGVLLALAFGIANLMDAEVGRPSLLLLGVLIAAGQLWYRYFLRAGAWMPRTEQSGGI